MANYSEVEEDLLAQQEEEEARAAALGEQKQLERMAQQEENSPVNQIQNAAREAAKSYVKSAIKQAGKEAVLEGAEAAGSAIVASAPVWAPILGILLVLVVGVIGIIIIIYTGCNQSGVNGKLARLASSVSGALNSAGLAFPPDVCAAFTTPTTPSLPNKPNGSTLADLVSLASYGIPVKSGVDDRATACMANRVLAIYSLVTTNSPPLDIEISSAYRPGDLTASGTPSAHGRGEAVDIALRNPTVPWNQTTHSLPAGYKDSRIDQLYSIALSVFPNGKASNTLNEYYSPAKNATAGHIHVEFNILASGSYCDGTAA